MESEFSNQVVVKKYFLTACCFCACCLRQKAFLVARAQLQKTRFVCQILGKVSMMIFFTTRSTWTKIVFIVYSSKLYLL